jgi:hypothetical protein
MPKRLDGRGTRGGAMRSAITVVAAACSLILAQGGLALAGTLPAPGASQATSSQATSSRGVQDCGAGPVLVRPSSLTITCADDGELAVHLAWSSWTAARAAATGFVTWRSCADFCADSKRWDSARADVTLTDPVSEAAGKVLFTRLSLHVTGATPAGFMRDLEISEAPLAAVQPSPRAGQPRAGQPRAGQPRAGQPRAGQPRAGQPRAGKRPVGASVRAQAATLGYAQIEGFWEDAGGPSTPAGDYNDAEIAAAITGAESSFIPGIIQQDVDYCGAGSDRAGWGLWQITCGNSVPSYGTDFQILDPWNNAEAAVSKYDADASEGLNGFDPWSTYTSGAYEQFLQQTPADTDLTDPGEYSQVGSTPSGTPSSPAPDPGSTYGPPMPGGSGIQAAFQANSGSLWGTAGSGGSDFDLGVAAGTSPSIASDGSQYEVAFQANSGSLWTATGPGAGRNMGVGMMAGTSPSIASLAGGGYEIAFQANTGSLWLTGTNGISYNQNLGMMKGTSPSIAALPGGGFEVAFQSNGGSLWIESSSGVGYNQDLGMMAGTSPSIAASPDGGFQVAVQANTGSLWTDTNGDGGVNQSLGMAAGTSPSDGGLATGGYEVAFQANSGSLWTEDNGAGTNQKLGMAAGTSPALAALYGSGYDIAFQANTGSLWIEKGGSGYPQSLGMYTGTSPALVAVS